MPESRTRFAPWMGWTSPSLTGEDLSVEGPSGSGKTTLLNLLGLLDVPTDGRVLWQGTPVERFAERERTRLRRTGIGFIFQRFYLLPTLTALEKVSKLPLQAQGSPRVGTPRRASALLAQVGLADRERSFPHQLVRRRGAARRNCPGVSPIPRSCCSRTSRRANSTRSGLQQVLDLLEVAHQAPAPRSSS